MREHAWLYPAVETLHIVGFSVLVGAVAMFDLRVLGYGRQLAVKSISRPDSGLWPNAPNGQREWNSALS